MATTTEHHVHPFPTTIEQSVQQEVAVDIRNGTEYFIFSSNKPGTFSVVEAERYLELLHRALETHREVQRRSSA